ncbi:hypothetical protein CQ011_12995 [Arthrobacter sp. MYb213]|nr:hypothetical protein CQ011_12995 [Arthrobacter sp. MYb213]
MYTAFGVLLAIIVAFVAPYIWDSSRDPVLFSTVSTISAFVVFCGVGMLLDRRRNRTKMK